LFSSILVRSGRAREKTNSMGIEQKSILSTDIHY
jgi:hypothetical protein